MFDGIKILLREITDSKAIMLYILCLKILCMLDTLICQNGE